MSICRAKGLNKLNNFVTNIPLDTRIVNTWALWWLAETCWNMWLCYKSTCLVDYVASDWCATAFVPCMWRFWSHCVLQPNSRSKPCQFFFFPPKIFWPSASVFHPVVHSSFVESFVITSVYLSCGIFCRHFCLPFLWNLLSSLLFTFLVESFVINSVYLSFDFAAGWPNIFFLLIFLLAFLIWPSCRGVQPVTVFWV